MTDARHDPAPAPLVELRGVAMRYAPQDPPVLTGIELTLARGDSLAITGPSGCGKSTLLNLIGALDRPTQGEVRFDGRSLAALRPHDLAALRNRRIGLVFQDHHLLPQCTVIENVLLPTLAGHGSPAGAANRAGALLRRVGLADKLAARPGQLSGGQRQRVAVVRAMINEPDLLLADEPTGSLDRAAGDALIDLLLDLNRERGLTLVVVTHAADVAARMARRVELHDGALD